MITSKEALDPLYTTNVRCVCCETPFTTSRMRPSFKKVIRADSDFCSYYSDDNNPDYYVVRVCPYCGFASTENSTASLTEGQKSNYLANLGLNWEPREYGGKRTLSQAMECYKIALLCAQSIEEKPRIIAGLLQHIAWLYRYMGDEQQERRFLRFALDAYIRVYEVDVNSINNAKLMYLIGELHRRLQDYNDAVKWFSRVIHNKKIIDGAMIHRSREQWQILREEMLANKMELPEAMQQ
ncbi:DUF2225 domain-containing protein [Paenibacillus sp. GCM10012307]|uniref:DUF2225 domain-containing protein n=1 Tax=Paenibacillus roseus TaxID=2798579 RepID=A0A934J6R7_9BACL|nr:DUF2225 domain-containing protein [Paenibacillus roseus]MBJ6361417.1 DUF2225 domain-containing protein [Paenibacillus roseus]